MDIFFNHFMKFILLLSWHTKRNDKMSDIMGLVKLDLSMLVLVSWYDPPKIPLLPILFLEMSLYCLKMTVLRPLLKNQIFYYSLFIQMKGICRYINEYPQEYFKHNLISYTSWYHSIYRFTWYYSTYQTLCNIFNGEISVLITWFRLMKFWILGIMV